MGAMLLDTSVLIDVLRGREGAMRRLATVQHAGDLAYTCAVNVEEVFRGPDGRCPGGLRPPASGISRCLGSWWRSGETRNEREA